MSRIAIDPARQLGAIDRKVFGGFVEHRGRCVCGGLYEEGSPLSDGRGFRTDVLGPLRDLRLGTLRWPGGNFASNCHWQDGIGPRDARPRRPELAWGGEEYVREATRWARAIRMLDPGALLAGCGETGWTDWDRVVTDGLAGLVAYPIHLYTGSDDASRWPYRVADLGPFTVVDAAAGVNANNVNANNPVNANNTRRIAVTLVNRATSAEPRTLPGVCGVAPGRRLRALPGRHGRADLAAAVLHRRRSGDRRLVR